MAIPVPKTKKASPSPCDSETLSGKARECWAALMEIKNEQPLKRFGTFSRLSRIHAIRAVYSPYSRQISENRANRSSREMINRPPAFPFTDEGASPIQFIQQAVGLIDIDVQQLTARAIGDSATFADIGENTFLRGI